MDRRRFTQLAPAALATAALASKTIAPRFAFAQAEPAPRALPTPDQVAWQDMEIGMFVHFAPNTWQDKESDDLSTPMSAINPTKLDTDQWARTALSFGAKYIVFVAKHQGGFCMWQTATTDYSIKSTPWRNGKGDVLADVAASCKKFGLKLGVYVCPRDDKHGARGGGVCATPELQAKYNAMYREQWREVLSRYGPLVECWFDGSSATPVADLLAQYQPHAMVFQSPAATIRWVGNEDGFAPYPLWNGIDRAQAKTGTSTAINSNPDGDTWLPSEVDVSIRRPIWFWRTNSDSTVLTPDQLMSIYYNSVGRGGQLLLNIPANRDGLLSDKDCASVKSFGDEVARRFSKPVALTRGNGTALTLKLPKPTPVDTIILQEDTTKGERIRAFTIEGRVGNNWQKLADGISVGHKRIQPLTPATVDAIRLTVTKYAGTPDIRTLAAYNIGVPPPADWNAAPQLWAPNAVGRWQNNAFTVDLTKRITAAAQYRIHFVPREGAVTIKDPVLKLGGTPNPTLLKTVPNHPDQLLLDITGLGETIQLSGTIDGPATGQILLQKL